MIEIDPFDQDAGGLRRAFACFPSGVTAVCSIVDGEPVGMAASSFTAVSLTPPLVSVCVQDTSETWPRLRSSRRLGLSVLAEGHDQACRSLSNKTGDRFAGVEWDRSRGGGIFVHGSSLWLECSLHAEVEAGDHAIAILQVHGLRAEPDTPPLIFHGSRFRRLAAI
ncbi:flavin reductase family protein [Nocardia alni]|uniref:flavin reductase family protein n=1 Tax=Nocardia alni TaxID=2815723 RepID=UPI001C24C6A3|nr:flavin reductase family protein [Nocardia alni]